VAVRPPQVVGGGRATFPKWLGVACCHPRQPLGVAQGQPLDLKVAARPLPVVGGGRAATPSGRGWPRGHPQLSREAARPPLVVGGSREAFPKWLGKARCHPRQRQGVAQGQPLDLKVVARPPQTLGEGQKNIIIIIF
jgi:hypothetical protein